jgi:hypothetical protein
MPPPERRDSDTPRSYAALCDYAALGPSRSIDKLLQMYNSSVTETPPPTKHRGTLGLWSGTHDWQARVAAYDSAIIAETETARAAIRAARRAELEEQDWTTGSDLRRACEALLMEMPRFLRHAETEITQNGELVKVITLALKAGPGELARALKLASELQRLSVGEPTERTEITGKDGTPLFPDFEQALEKAYASDDEPNTTDQPA